MFTHYDFYKGMFCELGGEFVDTDHEDLQKLGAELGVEMQKLAAEGDGEDLYFFKGQFHTPKDMIDPEKKTGAFAPIAKQIAEDAGKLTDKDDNWTAYATQARSDEPEGLSRAVPRQDRRLGDRSSRRTGSWATSSGRISTRPPTSRADSSCHTEMSKHCEAVCATASVRPRPRAATTLAHRWLSMPPWLTITPFGPPVEPEV